MSNQAGRIKAIETQAKRDGALGRSPANVSKLNHTERIKYINTHAAHKRT